MEFMKELSLNMSIQNQTFMLLYMSGPAPTNAAELNAAVDTHDFTDMWNKSIGCSYVVGVKSAYAGSGAEWTTFFNPVAGYGQLKGAPLRPYGHRIPANLAASSPLVPDTIEFQKAAGEKIPSCGWLGLFAAQALCRCPHSGRSDCWWLSPLLVPEFNPVAHVVLGFSEAKTFTGISLDTTSGTTFAVDYWDGSAWVQCVASKAATLGGTLFNAVSNKIRLRIGSRSGESYESFVLYEAAPSQARAHQDITWALMIPMCSRPTSTSTAHIQVLVNAKEITRQTKIPFYSMSVGGPLGSEEILLTKNTALTSADYPVATGFYIKSGNFVEA